MHEYRSSSTSVILFFSTLLLILTTLLFDGVKSDSFQLHFDQFGIPYMPLEHKQEKDVNQIIKRNVRTGKVEWRLAEILNRNVGIKEWTNETNKFTMLNESNEVIEKKILAPAMTAYANCVMKMKKMKDRINDKTTKIQIFMLNGAITIPEMKPIVGKRHSYLAEFVPKFLDDGQLEAVPTHFCTSLFIVEIDGKIGKQELVCTRIDRWTETDSPPNIGRKTADCGHSELYDHHLDGHLVNSGAENMLEFVQIKLAMDLAKMLKRLEAKHLVEGKKQKKNDQNMPTASIASADESQIEGMDPNLRIYKGFMLEYDPRKLIAHWLLERLTKENTLSKNQIKRRPNLKWNADPKLPTIFQPDERDYQTAKQFELNHGHLATFRAHRNDDVQQTFLYPNSVPQDRDINSGYWRVIEEYALCLAGHKQSIAYVYTGPLYIPEKNTDTGQWQMKYKVIGRRKMMAVPTHLFKIIFLEFTSGDDEQKKKTFWLETFVVSNGQEGEVEVVEEGENADEGRPEGIDEDENARGGDEEAVEEMKEEEEEEEYILQELGEGDNVYYILSKNEEEIEKILMKISDRNRKKATTSKGALSLKKTSKSQKLDKGEEKTPSEANVNVKKTENIEALVEGCQNRSYNIIYGDANSGAKISKLLKDHRKPLTYIDKFVPNFQLLAKLPAELRSEKNGVYFDENMAKLFEKNEKGKDKEATRSSHSGKFAGGTNQGKKGKKGGKSRNKPQQQEPKQKQQQQPKQPTSIFDVAAGSSSSANAAETENRGNRISESEESKFYDLMENFYTRYLFKSDSENVAQFLFDSIILQTSWHSIQSLLQSVKEKMLEDGKTIDAAQIDAIVLELYKNKNIDDIVQYHSFTINHGLEHIKNFKDVNKWDEDNICLLTHLRESIIYTFFSASSFRPHKSNNLRKFALEFEQKRWREFGILPEVKEVFSKYDDDDYDGERIAQIWMEKGNWCYDKSQENNEYVHKYKLDRQDLLFSTLKELMNKKEDFAKDVARCFRKNDSNAINNLMRILGIHSFKKFNREFKKFSEISPRNFQFKYVGIFRDAIFDFDLTVGYQRKKYLLQEFLYFFDYYEIMDSIDQFHNGHSHEISKLKIKNKSDKNILNSELRDIKNLKEELSKCLKLESIEISASMGQALMIRCLQDVYCQLQNMFFYMNFMDLNTRKSQKILKLHYFAGDECDRLITRHGTVFFTETFGFDQELSKKFYELYTETYDETTKRLISWALNTEMEETENIAMWEVDETAKMPNYESEFRAIQLGRNKINQLFAENEHLNKYLLLEHNNLADWQNIHQSIVELFAIETIMILLFDTLQSLETKIINVFEKEQAVKAAIIYENVQKISLLEEMFKQIVEKSKRIGNTMQDLCQLLVLRQHLLITIDKMGDEHLKNNPHLKNLIRQYGQIHKSDVPYDEEVAAGMLITMDGLDGYCHDEERRELLLRKYRHEVENMVASQLNMMFFTHHFGSMGKYQNYHLKVDLPAKLIKIAGVHGFMKIAMNHPLIMTNLFNLETVDAILFKNDNILYLFENGKEKRKELQQHEMENVIKALLMVDLILIQLIFSAHTPAEIANEHENVLTNEELEKRNQIDRAKTEGMDILMEWLDNSHIMKMMTKEERVNHARKVDEKAYLEISRVIISVPELKGEIDADVNQSPDSQELWRNQWREWTFSKLKKLELDKRKKSDDKKGKGKVEE